MEDTNVELYEEAHIKLHITSEIRAFITQSSEDSNWQQLWVEIEKDRFFPIKQDTFNSLLYDIDRISSKFADFADNKPKYEFFSDKTVYWARIIHSIVWLTTFSGWCLYLIFKSA